MMSMDLIIEDTFYKGCLRGVDDVGCTIQAERMGRRKQVLDFQGFADRFRDPIGGRKCVGRV